MGSPARFQHHRARGLRREERDHLAPAQLALDLGVAFLTDTMHLEGGLGGVEADHERWLAKFGQSDKWRICLKAAMMPRIRREHGEADPTDA